MILAGKDLGLCVKMFNGTHLPTAGVYAEGGVLESLEFLIEDSSTRMKYPFIY